MTTRQIPTQHEGDEGLPAPDGERSTLREAEQSTSGANDSIEPRPDRQPKWIERHVWTASRLSPALASAAAAFTIVLY